MHELQETEFSRVYRYRGYRFKYQLEYKADKPNLWIVYRYYDGKCYRLCLSPDTSEADLINMFKKEIDEHIEQRELLAKRA